MNKIIEGLELDSQIFIENKRELYKFKIYINSTNPYEVALVNLTTNNLVFKCNGGVESEKIEGFFVGMRYCGYEYHNTKAMKVNPDSDLFEKYGFTDVSNLKMETN